MDLMALFQMLDNCIFESKTSRNTRFMRNNCCNDFKSYLAGCPNTFLGELHDGAKYYLLLKEMEVDLSWVSPNGLTKIKWLIRGFANFIWWGCGYNAPTTFIDFKRMLTEHRVMKFINLMYDSLNISSQFESDLFIRSITYNESPKNSDWYPKVVVDCFIVDVVGSITSIGYKTLVKAL